MNLNEKIIYARKKKGMSQLDLADQLQVSRQAISKWETGEANPEITNLKSLANVLEVSVDWLLGDEEPVENQPVETKKSSHFLERYAWIIPSIVSAFSIIKLLFIATALIQVKQFEKNMHSMMPEDMALSLKFNGLFQNGTSLQPGQSMYSFFLSVQKYYIFIYSILAIIGIILAIYLYKWQKRKFAK